MLAKEIEPAILAGSKPISDAVSDAPLLQRDLVGAPAPGSSEVCFDATVLARGLASRCSAHCNASADGSRWADPR